jgi:hypothetical protein
VATVSGPGLSANRARKSATGTRRPTSAFALVATLAAQLLLAPALASAGPAPASTVRPFHVRSSDGTSVKGIAESPEAVPSAAVVMVPGTGAFDRDVKFANSGTPRDLLFKDLAARLNARGLATVRYDRRGVVYGKVGEAALDPAESATLTVASQRDDLRAVYDWTRSPQGLRARCVILFGHSEGLRHIAGLAESGAPPPLLVIGVGAPMRSPVEVMRWQMAERAVSALRLMDSDGNGEITQLEMGANWHRTPASGFFRFDGANQPRKNLTEADLQRIGTWQLTSYRRERTAALALDDAAPFPDAKAPVGRASWWKSWFTDGRPIADRLAAWPSPTILHYGEIDSQVLPQAEIAAARAALGARVTVRLHPARGHALGENGLLGPMDESIADQIADEIAAAARGCPA